MQVCLVHATTRSACFELQTGTCYKAPAPFEVLLDGQPVLTGAETNVFSLYHLEPARTYRLEVMAGEDCGSL